MSWYEEDWFQLVSLSVKISLVLSALYVSWVFHERAQTSFNREPERRPLHADLLIYLPRADATTLESARRKLIGIPLWVREGWRRGCEQDGRLLGPLEVVTITQIQPRGRHAYARFEKDGRPCDIAISADDTFYADEVFFIENPVVSYDHWSEEDWRKIRDHVVEPGMSYAQIGFSLGLGRITGGNSESFVVDYRVAERAGLDPVRVTYDNYTAVSIEVLPKRGN